MEQQRVVAEARRFLNAYDFAAVDVGQAVREWQAIQAKIAARGLDPDTSVGEELRWTAVNHHFYRDMRRHLKARGDNPNLVGMTGSSRGDCFRHPADPAATAPGALRPGPSPKASR